QLQVFAGTVGGFRREALAAGREPAMRAGADPGPVARGPVDAVVRGLVLSPACMVGDFVGGKAGCIGKLLRDLVEIGGALVVERRPVLALHRLEEGGAGFDRKLVE